MNPAWFQVDDRRPQVPIFFHPYRFHRAYRTREFVMQADDCRLSIRDDAAIGGVNLVDLLIGNVDVDELLALEKIVAEIKGCVLGKGVAHCQNYIRVEKRLGGAAMATVGKDPQPERVIFRDYALSVEGCGKGNVEPFDEGAQLGSGFAANRAIA